MDTNIISKFEALRSVEKGKEFITLLDNIIKILTPPDNTPKSPIICKL